MSPGTTQPCPKAIGKSGCLLPTPLHRRATTPTDQQEPPTTAANVIPDRCPHLPTQALGHPSHSTTNGRQETGPRPETHKYASATYLQTLDARFDAGKYVSVTVANTLSRGLAVHVAHGAGVIKRFFEVERDLPRRPGAWAVSV